MSSESIDKQAKELAAYVLSHDTEVIKKAKKIMKEKKDED